MNKKLKKYLKKKQKELSQMINYQKENLERYEDELAKVNDLLENE